MYKKCQREEFVHKEPKLDRDMYNEMCYGVLFSSNDDRVWSGRNGKSREFPHSESFSFCNKRTCGQLLCSFTSNDLLSLSLLVCQLFLS